MVSEQHNFKEGWRISTLAESDSTIEVNMLGKILSPQDNIVEAAETIYGCPVLLVMWHPEAYGVYATDSKVRRTHQQFHNRMLLNMEMAGDVYQARRKVLRNPP